MNSLKIPLPDYERPPGWIPIEQVNIFKGLVMLYFVCVPGTRSI